MSRVERAFSVAAAFLMHDDGYLLVVGGATEAALAAAFDDAAEKAADATERCVQRAFSRGLQAIVRQLAAEQSCPVESLVEVLRTRVRNESERTQTVTEAAGMADTPPIWWGWDCSAQRPGDMVQAPPGPSPSRITDGMPVPLAVRRPRIGHWQGHWRP